MKFTRNGNVKGKLGIGKTVLDDLAEHPVCKPMNDPDKDLDGRFKEGDKVWINPDNQFSFNAMWCDEKVLREWMEGKGPMVKGKNANEKKKYWDYAVFEATPIKLDDYNNTKLDHVQWMIKYHYRFFKEFTSDFDPHQHGGFGMHMSIKEPMDLKGIRSKEAEKKDKADERVIKDMFAPYVREIVKDLEYRSWDNIRHELEKEFYGIKRTLYTMGIGYMAASNTPEEIRNLSWVTGIVYAKGIYEYLKKIDYPMPDWEWLSKKSY